MKKIIKLLVLAFFFLLPFNVFGLDEEKVKLYLFYGDGCPHCAEEKTFLSSIENKYPNLEIIKYEVWYNKENSKLLGQIQEKLKIKRNGVPTTVIGEDYFVGYTDAVGAKIERAIEFYSSNEHEDVVQKIIDGTYVVKDEVEDNKTEFEEQEEETDEDMSVDVPLFGKVNLKNISLMSAAVVIG